MQDDAGSGYRGALPPARFNLARYCIGDTAARFPDKTALIIITDPDAPLAAATHLTFGALDRMVRSVAAGLSAAGLRPGMRLMVRLANDLDYILMLFGSVAAGLVPLPVSAALTEDEVAFLLEDSHVDAIALGDS